MASDIDSWQLKGNGVVPIKTLTFAVVHMAVAFSVVYVVTGNPLLGGAVALIEPMVNTVAYFFHERVWERFGHRFLPRDGARVTA